MSSTHKSYNEIVATCKLVDYKEEFAAKGSIWAEYWLDESATYKAVFTNHQTGWLPHTIYKAYPKDDL